MLVSFSNRNRLIDEMNIKRETEGADDQTQMLLFSKESVCHFYAVLVNVKVFTNRIAQRQRNRQPIHVGL